MDTRGAEAPAAQLMMVEPHQGKVSNGRFHGFGRALFASGNEYQGEFHNGRVQGLGTMVWEDGLKYVGELRRNNVSGRGCFDWPNGAEYYGEVHRGKRHGDGIYTFDDIRYAGEWQSGKRHGIGSQFSNTAVYYGEWSEGKRHGWGMIQFSSGNKYQGMWHEDSMCGFGTMNWVSLEKWHSAVDLGKVTSYKEAVELARTATLNVGSTQTSSLGPYTPATLASSQVCQKYTGQWKDNKPHGEGEYTTMFHNKKAGHSRDVPFQTQNRYVGEFVNGLREGFGIYHYADGTVYEGQWAVNLKHGPGTLHHADGTTTDMVMEHDIAKTGPLQQGQRRSSAINAPPPLSPKLSSRPNSGGSQASNSTTPRNVTSPKAGSTPKGGSLLSRQLSNNSFVLGATSSGSGGAVGHLKSVSRVGSDNRVNVVDLLPDMLPVEMVGTKESEKYIHDVNEILSKNQNALRHLYTVYSNYHHPVDLNATAVRLCEQQVGGVPQPANIIKLCSKLQLPESHSPLERNEAMTNHAVHVVVERAMESCNQAISKVMAATEGFETETAAAAETAAAPNVGFVTMVEEGQLPSAEDVAKITVTPEVGLGDSVTSGLACTVSPSRFRNDLGSPGERDTNEVTMPVAKERRAATPMDSTKSSRTTSPALPEVAPVPKRRNTQPTLTLRQFHSLLLDAQIIGVGFTVAEINDTIYPAILRRKRGSLAKKLSLEEETSLFIKKDMGGMNITFPVFMECLVRIAHYKFTRTAPYMAASIRKEISLPHQVRYLVESFLLPLMLVLKDMDCTGELRRVGIDPLFQEGNENSTLDDLRKIAIRLFKDHQRLSKPVAGATTTENPLGANPSVTPATPLASTIGTVGRPRSGATENIAELPPPIPGLTPSELGGGGLGRDLDHISLGNADAMTTAGSELSATAEAKRKRKWSGVASIRAVDAEVEVIEIEVTRTTHGSMSTSTHHLIVHIEDGIRRFGGVIMQYRLDQLLVANKSWREGLIHGLSRNGAGSPTTTGKRGTMAPGGMVDMPPEYPPRPLSSGPQPPGQQVEQGEGTMTSATAPMARIWMSHLPILEVLELRMKDVYRIFKKCAAPSSVGLSLESQPGLETRRRVQLFHLMQLLVNSRLVELTEDHDGCAKDDVPKPKKSKAVVVRMAPVTGPVSPKGKGGKANMAASLNASVPIPMMSTAPPSPSASVNFSKKEDARGGLVQTNSSHTPPDRVRPACTQLLKVLLFDLLGIEVSGSEIQCCVTNAEHEHAAPWGQDGVSRLSGFGIDPMVLRSLLKTSPDLAEALRLRALEEDQRVQLMETYSYGTIKVGNKYWWTLSQQIFLPFEEFSTALVAVAQRVYSDEASIPAALNSLLDSLLRSLDIDFERQQAFRASRGQEPVPGAEDGQASIKAEVVSELWQTKNTHSGVGQGESRSLESQPPLIVEKAWPKQKRKNALEDPKKKKGKR